MPSIAAYTVWTTESVNAASITPAICRPYVVVCSVAVAGRAAADRVVVMGFLPFRTASCRHVPLSDGRRRHPTHAAPTPLPQPVLPTQALPIALSEPLASAPWRPTRDRAGSPSRSGA